MDFLQLLKDFGPFAGVILFFIWRDWKREDRLVARVEALEKYQVDVLSDLVKESLTVIANNSEQLRWTGALIQSCHHSGRRNDET
jgi:hypothetical protein